MLSRNYTASRAIPAIKYVIVILLMLKAGIVSAQFKVIGYLPYYQFHRIDDIELDKLTHLNIAFANPDMAGNLSVGGRDIQPIVDAAHDEDLDVFISLAGGALTAAWEQAWAFHLLPENKSAFIHKIINYCHTYDLQGIDVDLEWSHVDEYYSPFVLELRDSATAHDLVLTAALPGTYRFPDITAEVLAAYDWINMMVYDLRGPWNPNDVGPHSPVSFAHSSINYWDGQGVEVDRLTLGVPFYGYDFSNQSNVHAVTYRYMVDMDSQNAYVDEVNDVYYNGIPTIEEKTQIAIDQLSGIMIWELGQDHYSQYSLLKHMDAKIQELTDVDDVHASRISIGPNPFRHTLTITSSEPCSYAMYNAQGQLVLSSQDVHGQIDLSTSHLPDGMYVLKISNGVEVVTRRVVKVGE